MVLKTRSCSLLTTPRRSSPSAAIFANVSDLWAGEVELDGVGDGVGGGEDCGCFARSPLHTVVAMRFPEQRRSLWVWAARSSETGGREWERGAEERVASDATKK